MTSKCLVTLTIGDKYKQQWEHFCKTNWTAYANKFGYDLITISEPPDLSLRSKNRSPAWLKCLILGLPETSSYDQVVWVDADILINNQDAPDICSFVPQDRIGGVEAYSYPTPILYRRILKRKYDQWSLQSNVDTSRV
jgi:hypothetical protein